MVSRSMDREALEKFRNRCRRVSQREHDSAWLYVTQKTPYTRAQRRHYAKRRSLGRHQAYDLASFKLARLRDAGVRL